MHDMTVRFELFVADTARSTAFYRDVLGFEATAEFGDDGSSYVELRNGDAIIGVQREDMVARAVPDGDLADFRSPPAGVEVVLEVDDVDAYHQRVRASGHPMAADLEERPWGERDFRVRDPDGYYLRITSRRTTRYQRLGPCGCARSAWGNRFRGIGPPAHGCDHGSDRSDQLGSPRSARAGRCISLGTPSRP